jgi:hypothetical protein
MVIFCEAVLKETSEQRADPQLDHHHPATDANGCDCPLRLTGRYVDSTATHRTALPHPTQSASRPCSRRPARDGSPLPASQSAQLLPE